MNEFCYFSSKDRHYMLQWKWGLVVLPKTPVEKLGSSLIPCSLIYYTNSVHSEHSGRTNHCAKYENTVMHRNRHDPAFTQTMFYWGTRCSIRNGNINKCYDDREVRLRVLVTCSQTHCLPLPDVIDHLQRWPPWVLLLVPTWQYPARRWGVFLHLIEWASLWLLCSGDPRIQWKWCSS